MKNYLNNGAKALIFFFACALLGSTNAAATAGLTSLFTPVDTIVQPLSPAQRIIYNKALVFGIYKTFQIVHMEPIADVQQNGELSVTLDHAECPTYHFDNRTVEYKDQQHYYWYGNLVYDDSASDCSKGSIMLFTDSAGLQYGHMELENRTFEVIDLTGDLQLIAQVDNSLAAGNVCGTSSTHTNDDLARSTQVTGIDGGYLCTQRVLCLMTPAAYQADPMNFSRCYLGCYMTKQAMINSGVNAYKMNLVFDFAFVMYNESPYTFNPTTNQYVGGLYQDKDNMYNDPALTASFANFQAIYHPDVIVMIVKNSSDNTKGLADQSDAPVYNFRYAVVQTGWASNAGYSLAHELGHLLGARHSNEGLTTDGADYTPSIAHAHSWNWTTYTGTWFWQKGHTYQGKSITYQSTAGDNSVFLGYSTPLIATNGVPHGVAGDRDAGQEFKNVGCIVSNYDNTPDQFAAVIGPDVPTNAAGQHIYCLNKKDHELTAYVTGPAGSYSYLWEMSGDGIHWTYAGNASSLGLYITYVGVLHFRCTITSPAFQLITVYYDVQMVTNCDPAGLWRATTAATTQNPLTHIISVSPNPAPNENVIRYALAQSGPVSIGLYDMGGKLVAAMDVDGTEGTTSTSLSTKGIANGNYLLKFVAGSYTENKKITVKH